MRNSSPPPRTQTRSRAAASAALLLAVAAGCGETDGPARAPVGGTVSVGSEPLEAGVIRFVPIGETKGPMATVAVADGRYAVSAREGPVVGTHRVEIEATDFLGFPPDDEAAARRALQAGGGRLPPSPVPAGYSGHRSPLTADIPPEGHEELNFRLAPRGPTAARR